MACNDFQQKFQHAEYFTCDPLISQPIFIRFSNDFHCFSNFHSSYNMMRRLILVVINLISQPLQVQGMPGAARVIIASKSSLSYSALSRLQ